MTLGILAIVTLLVVAFAISMRVENMASKNFNDMIKARQLAQAAVDDAVALIRSATPVPSASPASTWVAAPGAIYVYVPGPGILRSNLYTDAVLGFGAVDLNNGLLITGNNSFYNSYANSAITAGWMNVQATIGGVPNVLVGRFAYWVDVDSSKVNINNAGTRTPSNPANPDDPLMNQSIPSDIDLRALEPPFYETPTLIGNFITAHSAPPPSQPWFSTIEEMRRGMPDPSDGGFNSNKFFTTVGTIDTNTDAFGRDRVDLTAITTPGAGAYNTAYSRLTDDLWATILYKSIGLTATRNTLQKKYGEFGARQILANIIDYQSPFANLSTADPVAGWVDGIPKFYCGLKKSPMIDEVAVHVATNLVDIGGSRSNLEVRVFVDVKLVNGYEVARGNGYVVKVALQGDPIITYINAPPPPPPPTWAPPGGLEQTRTLTANVATHGYGLLGQANVAAASYVGGYPPLTYMTTIAGTAGAGVPVLQSLSVKLKHVTLFKSGAANDIVDWMAQTDFDTAPLLPAGAGMTFPNATLGAGFVTNSPDFAKSSGGACQPIALFKQDPRVRTFPGWTAGSTDFANNGPNLQTNWFVVASSAYVPTTTQNYSSRISPEVYRLLADLRSIESVSAISPVQHYLIDRITEQAFRNVGELSYIHTGYPWRTIRLRSVYPATTTVASVANGAYADFQLSPPTYSPRGDVNTGSETIETNALPDWIVLDVFKIGSPSALQGRVNVNARFSGPANTLTSRTVPLAALLDYTSQQLSTDHACETANGTNLLSIGSTTFGMGLALNVANRVFTVPTTVIVPPNPYAALPAYFTPGEICEVQNLGYFADPEVAPQPTYPSKTRRQQLIRRISNLITTRSNLFTIWATAQSIKEVGTPDGIFNGQDFITGEVKVQAIVERYEEAGAVKFRTKYFRYIYQ